MKRSDLTGDRGVRQSGPQEVDIVSLARPITKLATRILDPSTARASVEQAIHTARHARKGPVWLDVPLDVQAAQIDPVDQPPFAAPREGTIEPKRSPSRSSAKLDHARRPVIMAGNGVRLAGGIGTRREVIELLGVPLLTSRKNGIDVLPADHPLSFGRPGRSPIAMPTSRCRLQT